VDNDSNNTNKSRYVMNRMGDQPQIAIPGPNYDKTCHSQNNNHQKNKPEKYLPFRSENDIVKYDQDKNSQKSPKAVWFQYFMLEGREAKR
jgi:hypothetical protein